MNDSDSRGMTDEEWDRLSCLYFIETGQPIGEHLRSSFKVGPCHIVVDTTEDAERLIRKGIHKKSIIFVVEKLTNCLVKEGELVEISVSIE